MKKLLGNYDRLLFWLNISSLAFICLIAILFTERFNVVFNTLQAFITLNFGWFYSFVVAVALIFCLFLAFSKYGTCKLGKDEEEPEYSTFTWVAMLFSSGIGVGVYFWAVAEPMYHYLQTPYITVPGTPEAMPQALAVTYFHWGIHGWALFALVGLDIAYSSYRFDRPLSFSSAFYGILGEKTNGTLEKILDFICAFATVAGLSTSIGMGVLSLSFVVCKLFKLQPSIPINLGIMAVIFVIYSFSTAVGIKKGMARVSNINLYLFFSVSIFVFIFGPTRFILNLLMDGVGQYIQYMPYMTFWCDSINQTGGWKGWWTLFYWAWWLSWTPFVGGFLARISRGRSFKQYILGAMIFPTLMCFVWFAIMGGTAFNIHLSNTLPLWEAVQTQVESGYYVMLEGLPLTYLISIIALINLLTFLVTSADAGSIYVGVVLSKGNPNPTIGMKLVCAVLIAALPIALIIGGGLKALQTMSIVAAFPFAITLLLTVISVLKMCRVDNSMQFKKKRIDDSFPSQRC